MVGIPPSRRDFLRTLALSAGAALASGCARFRLPGRRPAKVSRWALLADTHVSRDPNDQQRGFRINDNCQTVVEQIVEASPEGAVIIGDLARAEGRVDDYRVLQQLIEPMISRMPVALVLGNHDHRDNFFKLFPERIGKPVAVKGKHTFIVEWNDLRFLMLDSLFVVNATAGLLGKTQRQWLERFLDQSDRRPTFLFVHHTLSDEDGALLDTDRFSQIVVPRKQVKAVFYGHTHNYKYDRIKGGLHLINVPAVAYSFRDSEPLGWVDARLTAEGGEFTLRSFASNTSLDGRTTTLDWRG